MSIFGQDRNDKLGIVQKEISRLDSTPIAAQFMEDHAIALFEFELSGDGVSICGEEHYRLVSPEDLTSAELEKYQERLSH